MDALEIGGFLSELRKQKGLKQKDVAEALQVSDKAISRWETGRGIPDVDSLQRLSDYYEVSINEILAGRRIEQNEVEKVADQNLKVAVKKQSRLKKKLLTAIAAVMILLILLVSLLLAAAPVTTVSVSFARGYCVSGDDGMKTLEEVFRVIDGLDEKGMNYTISLDTRRGERYIDVVVILCGEPHFMRSCPSRLTLNAELSLKTVLPGGIRINDKVLLNYMEVLDNGDTLAEMSADGLDLDIGQNVELSYRVQTDNFVTCIPAACIHTNEYGGIYVYIAEEREGILGTEWKVRKVSVTIPDRTDSVVAVESVEITTDTKIVVSSTKELSDGDTVRMVLPDF